MENNQLAQYYNEQFKQPLDPPFETLTPEDAQRFKKIFERSVGFAAWKRDKAIQQLTVAVAESFKKINDYFISIGQSKAFEQIEISLKKTTKRLKLFK